jgi:hypothetical protein
MDGPVAYRKCSMGLVAALLSSCASSASVSHTDGATSDESSADASGRDGETGGRCRSACEAAVPNPIPCGGRAGVIDDCAQRCGDLVASLSPACAACIIAAISYHANDPSECTFGPAQAVVGVNGECAVTACDAVFPCYGTGSGDTCQPVSHCVQPCGPMQGRDGICAFTQSGSCTCHGGSPGACPTGTTCVCPSCGDGEGLCVTPAQRASVCFPSYASDTPQAQAQMRFACP